SSARSARRLESSARCSSPVPPSSSSRANSMLQVETTSRRVQLPAADEGQERLAAHERRGQRTKVLASGYRRGGNSYGAGGRAAARSARRSASLSASSLKTWQGRRLPKAPKEKPTWRIRDRLSAFQVTTTVANRCTATVQRYSMRLPIAISRPLLKKPVATEIGRIGDSDASPKPAPQSAGMFHAASSSSLTCVSIRTSESTLADEMGMERNRPRQVKKDSRIHGDWLAGPSSKSRILSHEHLRGGLLTSVLPHPMCGQM
ncbi:hypothetical protein THAOC_28933, partial [Thalassiosira oceanica]